MGFGVGIGIGIGGGSAGGGLTLSPSRIDPFATGEVAALRSGLRGDLSFLLLSGASGIAIGAAGAVSLTDAIGVDGSASFIARVENGDGDAVERAFTLWPRPGAVNPLLFGFAAKGFNFDDANLPGHLYGAVWPASEAQFAYAAARGYGFIRLELLWERLQRDLMGELGCTFDLYSVNVGDPMADVMVLLENQLSLARQYGLKVLPVPMNYGARALYTGGAWTLAAQGAYSYRSRDRKFPIGSDEVPIAAFADFWSRFAGLFVEGGQFADYADTLLGLELMNEPTQLVDGGATNGAMHQAAITAIRDAGYGGHLYINGYAYATTRYWTVQNAGALDTLVDPADRLIAVGHYYPDSDHSGNFSADSVRPAFGTDLNRAVTENADWDNWWANADHPFAGRFLGEVGLPRQSQGNYWEEIVRRLMAKYAEQGVGINLEGAWPIGNADATINILPVPFDPDQERGLVKILTSLRQKTAYARGPIGLGDIVVAGAAGNKAAGAAFAGAATNFTAGSTLTVNVKSYAGDNVAGPVLTGNEAGGYAVAGNWPAAGDIYSLILTETRGALVKDTVYSVNVVAAAVPQVRAVPTTSGAPNVGQAQGGATGLWTNAPTSYDYKRQRDGVDIDGSAGNTAAGTAIPAYDYVADDAGHDVRLGVRANNAAGAGAWSYSDPVTVGAAIADTLADLVTGAIFESRVIDMAGSTAQAVPNAIATPADGEAQATYTLYRGITSANESQDPAYVAAADGVPAYLANNGSSYCAAPFTEFTQNLGNDKIWTFVALYKCPAEWPTSGFVNLFTFGGNVTDQPGVQFRWDAANSQFSFKTVNGANGRSVNMAPGFVPPTSGYLLIALCWDATTRNWKLYANSGAPIASGTATATTANVGSAVVADPAVTPRYILGQLPAGAGMIVPGALIAGTVTDAEVAAILAYCEDRLGAQIVA